MQKKTISRNYDLLINQATPVKKKLFFSVIHQTFYEMAEKIYAHSVKKRPKTNEKITESF